MVFEYDGATYNYVLHNGGGKSTVVFLHGFGGDLNSFAGAFRFVCDMGGVNAINIAFPRIVPPEWGIYDYAKGIRQLLEELGITSPILVGHSFGGRVSIILASQQFASKLILVDAAGIKPRMSIKKRYRIYKYHVAVRRGKPLDGFGSKDYNITAKENRDCFVRIVNTHLDGLLKHITCPTLIVWGKNDCETPPYMARRLHRGIANSTLEFIDGGHYCYTDSAFKFYSKLKYFLTE